MTALIIELMPPMHLDAGMNNSNITGGDGIRLADRIFFSAS